MPVRVCFTLDYTGFDLWDWIADLIFMLDLILNFFTITGIDKDNLDGSQKVVIISYVKTWFLFDFFCTIPLYINIVRRLDTSIDFPSLLLRLIRMLTVSRIIQLFKFGRYSRYFEFILRNPKISSAWVQFLSIMAFLLLFSHFAACVWYLIGMTHVDSDLSWVNRMDSARGLSGGPFVELGIAQKYLTSFYWAITTMTTVGTGDILAHTTLEIIWSGILSFVGVMVFTLVMAVLTSIISTADSKESVIREKRLKLLRFCNSADLPRHLISELLHEMEHHWSSTGAYSHFFEHREVMDDFPRPLLRKVIEVVGKTVYEQSEVLSLLHDVKGTAETTSLAIELMCEARPVEFSSGEYIHRKDDEATGWYLIREGTVHAVSSIDSQVVYMELVDGDSFGEIALLLNEANNKWPVCIRAASSPCFLFFVPLHGFLRVLGDHPGGRTILTTVGQERWTAINATRSQHEQDLYASKTAHMHRLSAKFNKGIVSSGADSPMSDNEKRMVLMPEITPSNRKLFEKSPDLMKRRFVHQMRQKVQARKDSLDTTATPSPLRSKSVPPKMNRSQGQTKPTPISIPQDEKISQTQSEPAKLGHDKNFGELGDIILVESASDEEANDKSQDSDEQEAAISDNDTEGRRNSSDLSTRQLLVKLVERVDSLSTQMNRLTLDKQKQEISRPPLVRPVTYQADLRGPVGPRHQRASSLFSSSTKAISQTFSSPTYNYNYTVKAPSFAANQRGFVGSPLQLAPRDRETGQTELHEVSSITSGPGEPEDSTMKPTRGLLE